MQKTNSLQDLFLLRARKTKANVTLFLMNGYQLRGQIVGYDPFVVVLVSEGKQQVIYKHAISTIAPERPVPLESDDCLPAPPQVRRSPAELSSGGR